MILSKTTAPSVYNRHFHHLVIIVDKVLRQRLVGVTIIVILAVIFLPILFDGSGIQQNQPSANPSTASQTVTLPNTVLPSTAVAPAATVTQNPAPATIYQRQEPPQLDSTAAANTPLILPAPQPQAAAPQPQTTAPQPQIQPKPVATPKPQPKPQPKPVATPKPQPAPAPSGNWQIQVGSFGNASNAQKLAAQLKQNGFAARVEIDSDKKLNRVIIGGFKTQNQAEQAQQQLKKHYQNKTLVQKVKR